MPNVYCVEKLKKNYIKLLLLATMVSSSLNGTSQWKVSTVAGTGIAGF